MLTRSLLTSASTVEKILKITNCIGSIFRHTRSEVFLVTAVRSFCLSIKCNKLLNKLEELKKVIPEDFLIFSETLDALKNVKISCFGAEAHPDYKERINEFETKWEELYITHDMWFTNKVHVIIDHVPQSIERTGKGLL